MSVEGWPRLKSERKVQSQSSPAPSDMLHFPTRRRTGLRTPWWTALLTVSLACASSLTAEKAAPPQLDKLLPLVTQGELEEAIQIEYELERTTGAVSSDEVARVIKQTRDQWENMFAQSGRSPSDEDRANNESMIAKIQQQLENGTRDSTRGKLILTKEFKCLVIDGKPRDGQPTKVWRIFRDGTLYTYREDYQEMRIRSNKDTIEEYESARDAIGRIGKIPREISDEFNKNGRLIRNEDSRWTIDAPYYRAEVLLEKENPPKVLNYTRVLGNGRETMMFGNYADTIGGAAPQTVLRSLVLDGATIKESYKILKTDRFDPSTKIPMISTGFGLIEVTDARFRELITYYALSELPGDKQVLDWIANPEALKKHNAEMRKLAPR